MSDSVLIKNPTSTLFVRPPMIDPAEYLGEAEAQKCASVRLTSPPNGWADEVINALIREHPYIDPNRAIVNFKNKDEGQGYAVGFVGIDGAPRISIPIIIQGRMLKPIDIMIQRNDSEQDMEQGVGDMTEDTVTPLNEDTFNMALDSGEAGELVEDREMRGTNWTEDGSSLTIPFTGRTVLASVLGATDEQKEKLGSVIAGDKNIAAGFAIHNGYKVQEWLAAPLPGRLVHQKLAAHEIELPTAELADGAPETTKTAEIMAAEVYTNEGIAKAAMVMDVVDLTNPTQASRVMVFEDGTYTNAPDQVATVKAASVVEPSYEPNLVDRIISKIGARAINKGDTISFLLDDHFTAPAKVAGVTIDDAVGAINLKLVDGFKQVNVTMSQTVKTAVLANDRVGWVVPFHTRILKMGEYASESQAPMPIEKVARYIESIVPDKIICGGGQFSLKMAGRDFDVNQVSEEKCAEVLTSWLSNGEALLDMVKAAAAENGGSAELRFRSNIDSVLDTVESKVAEYAAFDEIADDVIGDVGMDIDKAIKLASALSDPDGVDAVLGTGFLTHDNIAEFAGLADQFDGIVSKLARLLLLIRLGYPEGDEQATMVAMKALKRVAERLEGMGSTGMPD